MQCEIRSMSEKMQAGGGQAEQQPQQPRIGFVNQVCREWLVHEDNALAHRLQEEEIELHYRKNRTDRQVVQQDFREARELQVEEDVEADEIQQMYERMMLDQESKDAQVAMQLQESEKQRVTQNRQMHEEEDERIAWQLQEKENQRYERKKKSHDHDKERRQIERGNYSGDQTVANDCELQSSVSSTQLSSSDKNTPDLPDFQLETNLDSDEIENRRIREEQDAELARLLQEQESKRSGCPDRDRLLAIEAQDRELAKLLQEQERAKVRRAKERARLKALQRQAEQGKEGEELEKKVVSGETVVSTHDTDRRPVRPTDLDIPGLDPGKDLGRLSNKGRSATGGSLHDGTTERRPLPQLNPDSTHSSSVNIAIAIDPTYNRRLKKNAPAVAQSSSAIEISRSNGSTPVLPSPVSVRTATYGDDHCYDSDEGPAPPYMPIQGQKRVTSLEKKKKSKEACRHQ